MPEEKSLSLPLPNVYILHHFSMIGYNFFAFLGDLFDYLKESHNVKREILPHSNNILPSM
ncbi:hypothetical protein DOT_1511 [Desulfosporosinus sp. OT]|nr:hypothetical protein DOT_1511 [Desulfosporosinus sp. OT]